jgi:hypothetical protein
MLNYFTIIININNIYNKVVLIIRIFLMKTPLWIGYNKSDRKVIDMLK